MELVRGSKGLIKRRCGTRKRVRRTCGATVRKGVLGKPRSAAVVNSGSFVGELREQCAYPVTRGLMGHVQCVFPCGELLLCFFEADYVMKG